MRTVEDADLNTANNNNSTSNNNEDSAVERELEESKRFFSRFAPPVAHHNMVQYSHLGKTLIFLLNFHYTRYLNSTNSIHIGIHCMIPFCPESHTI